MQYTLWKEESIPDLINDDEDMELLEKRNDEMFLDDNIDEQLSH